MALSKGVRRGFLPWEIDRGVALCYFPCVVEARVILELRCSKAHPCNVLGTMLPRPSPLTFHTLDDDSFTYQSPTSITCSAQHHTQTYRPHRLTFHWSSTAQVVNDRLEEIGPLTSVIPPHTHPSVNGVSESSH